MTEIHSAFVSHPEKSLCALLRSAFHGTQLLHELVQSNTSANVLVPRETIALLSTFTRAKADPNLTSSQNPRLVTVQVDPVQVVLEEISVGDDLRERDPCSQVP